MMDYFDHVFNNFFQDFYSRRIASVKFINPHYSKVFDLAVFKFWCSVIDFYGGIYFVGLKNEIQKSRNKKLKLTSGVSFNLFIEKFFPHPENQYGSFIYKIFRSGIVHQLSPKHSGICWKEESPLLLWIEFIEGETNPKSNKIAHLNLKCFQDLTFDACSSLLKFTKNDPVFCQNIYTHLIAPPDAFGDGEELDRAYKVLLGKGIDLKK